MAYTENRIFFYGVGWYGKNKIFSSSSYTCIFSVYFTACVAHGTWHIILSLYRVKVSVFNQKYQLLVIIRIIMLLLLSLSFCCRNTVKFSDKYLTPPNNDVFVVVAIECH